MPPRRLPAYFHDVVEACRIVGEHIDGFDLDSFLADRKTRDAVERQLTIVDEAVNHIRRLDPPAAAALGPVDQIVAFRNVLVHGYSIVEAPTVWEIATVHAPALRIAADRILRTLPPPGAA